MYCVTAIQVVLYQRRFEKQPITLVRMHWVARQLYQRRFEKQPITHQLLNHCQRLLYQRRFEKQPITDCNCYF